MLKGQGAYRVSIVYVAHAHAPGAKGRRFEKGADGLGKRAEVVGRERLFVHQSGEVEHFASRYRVDPCDALHQRVGAGVFGAVGQKGEGLRGQGFGRHAVERGRRLICRPRVDGPHAILARARGSQRPEDFVRLGVNENDIGISPDQFHDKAAIRGRANAVAFARDEMHNALVGDVFNADNPPTAQIPIRPGQLHAPRRRLGKYHATPVRMRG